MSTSSRLSQARKAVRPALKGRMMLSGPAGAGKTRSALIIAGVLAEGQPILGIDTEKESMLTYADDFDFTHLPWAPPYDPRELVTVLAEAGPEYGVIIVDSLSHFWRKEGGVLDIANGKFTGWKDARPVQEDLVEAILNCPAHVVLGVRSKVEHTQETENGKQVVKKLGMAAQQDDDLEFEMNVAIELSMDHTATISKSRTTVLPVSRAFRPGQIAEMARLYGDWLKGGEPPAARDILADLLDRIEKLEPERRKACKNEFVVKFGRPEQLRESQVADADALVYGWEHPTDPGAPFDPPPGGAAAPAPTPEAGHDETTANPETGEVRQPALTSVPSDEHPSQGRKPRATRTPGQLLHIEASRHGISEDDLDVLILHATNGRTDSANDVTTREDNVVRAEMEAGPDRLDRIRQAVAERFPDRVAS